MISTKEILNGFMRNYGSLKVGLEDTFTSWTFKSMDYFNQIGKLLGYWVEFEGHRYDLTWYKYENYNRSKYIDESNLFLHVEHENRDYRIRETIEKLIGNPNHQKAKKRIGIVYPQPSEFKNVVDDFKNKDVELINKGEEIMVIFLGLYKESKENGYWPAYSIRKYSSKRGVLSREYKHKFALDENEILYCTFE